MFPARIAVSITSTTESIAFVEDQGMGVAEMINLLKFREFNEYKGA